jgi:Lrp/AsnC family transcriptional regulator
MFEKIPLDAGDIRILRILQEDASLAISEIASRTGMSQTPCWRRIKRMKDAGVIRQISAVVEREAVGLGFLSYTFVKLGLPSQENMAAFDKLVREWPEVIACDRITGAVDYLIKVVSKDMKSYDNFLRTKLLDGNLVSDVQSHIVVSGIKDSASLPLTDPPVA